MDNIELQSKMFIKSLFFLALLLFAIQSVQCSLTGRATFFASNSSIVFKRKNTVKINGTRFSELRCTAYDSVGRKSCSNVTEVTCEQQLGRIRSCSVSNKDSIFFNSSVLNETLECNRWKQIEGNCRLIYSLDSSKVMKLARHPQKDGEFVNNPFATSDLFEDHNKEFERRSKEADDRFSKWTKIAFITFGVFAALCFGCPLLLCCAIFINVRFLASRYDIPCQSCLNGGGSSMNVASAGTSYR